MDKIKKAMQHLNKSMGKWDQRTPVPFNEFLKALSAGPHEVVRNVFQLFHDMVKSYIEEGVDEYPDDLESIHYVNYDCTRLFAEGADHPFFADRLFANRLVSLVEALKRGAQQNKIYIFEGPPGCGKSTFLNNLLKKFEEFANTPKGLRFETVWRFDRKMMGGSAENDAAPLLDKLSQLMDTPPFEGGPMLKQQDTFHFDEDFIEIPCPSHDNPLLMIPKEHRREFLDDLFKNDEFKWKLSTEKEYEWVFRDNPCTICSSLYEALLNKFKSPEKVFETIYARPFKFNRRLGEGISVFNPGDKPMRQDIMSNIMLQRRINSLLRDSNQVKYIFSQYAKTNNGIYALMDIKSHNKERLIELHNIISEGIHKVEDIEENVNSLLLAVMNPEDQKNIQDFKSFSDRIEYINIPYVMDLNTEVEIYRNIFGKHIDESFLPRVLHNFARIIISSRLNTKSESLLEWIGNPEKYRLYCDENLQLLKMEIYTGHIPNWLTEELADKGKYSIEFKKLLDADKREEFDAHTKNGKEFIFKIRENLCDFLFVNTFVDQDFITGHKLFVSGRRLNQNKKAWEFYVKSRKAKDYRKMLLDTLYHPPNIEIDPGKSSNTTLYLVHHFEQKPLVKEFISNTMMGIEYLWGGPITLETSEIIPAPPQPPAGFVPGYPIPVKEELKKPEIKWQRVLYKMENRKLSKKNI